jgi:hypothetical protein
LAAFLPPRPSRNLLAARSRNLIEPPAVTIEHSLFSGESLPSQHGDVDIPRIDFHAVADSTAGLGCNQRAGTPKEGVVTRLAQTRVIQERSSAANR